MPRYDRSEIHRGMRMTGGSHPVEDPRHARIRKGMFLTSAPAPLPKDLEQFEQTAAQADRLGEIERRHGHIVKEMAQRLQAARQQIEAINAKRAKR